MRTMEKPVSAKRVVITDQLLKVSFTVNIISVGATPARIPTKILERSKARKG